MSKEDRDESYEYDIYGYPAYEAFGEGIYVRDEYLDERWLPVDESNGKYWVSNYGRAYSVTSGQFLKLKKMDKAGHLGICMSIDGQPVYRYIHRLVAEAFIPNPNHYPIVRHIQDVRDNNAIDDLEWGTQRDNTYDSIRNGHAYFLTDEDREKGFKLVRKPVIASNLSTGEETIYPGQCDAARDLGIQQANIWKVLNGQRPQAGGYSFRYKEVKEDA